LEGSASAPAKRATAGFALSLIAGIFVLINGLAWIALSSLFDSLGLGGMFGFGLALDMLGILLIMFAIIIFIGAYLIYMPGRETLGGILVLIFSIVSFIGGGGFFIGAILGIVGGALGLAKK
jgi:hypothetical protein